MTDNTRYYEQSDHWDHDYLQAPMEEQRFRETVSLIPDDVQSILDVGCGNGAFLNSLPPRYRTMGIDFSEEALKHVRTETLRCDIRSLDVPDGSFDMVTCLEVIEHLNRDTYSAALAEMERVARKYILISVPNDQNLDLSLVTCRACRCQFNPTYHVRSFTESGMRGLFRTFEPVMIQGGGPLEDRPTLPAPVAAAYRTMLREPAPKTAICPQCGYQESLVEERSSPAASNTAPGRLSLVRTATAPVRLAGRLLWRPVRRHRWLIALYKAR